MDFAAFKAVILPDRAEFEQAEEFAADEVANRELEVRSPPDLAL